MSKFNPTFKINLIRLFNSALSGKSVAERNQLRGVLSNASFRSSFGKAVIEKIVERTGKSLDQFDNNMNQTAPYSDAYKKSDVFKIYNKSSRVNLELTGEMLSSMKSVDASQSIVIEMVGDNNKAKAHGHKYGLGRKKVKRDFLGLPEDDLQQLMNETIEQFRDEEFATAMELFQGSEGVVMNGQVGNQSDFSAVVSIAEILRNLNGNK